MNNKNIVLFGIPRSGTTWISEVLCSNNNLIQVHELDNERHSFLGFFYKKGLPRFPYIRQTEKAKSYKKLFKIALFSKIITRYSDFSNLFYKTINVTKDSIEKSFNKNNTACIETNLTCKFLKSFLCYGTSNKRKLVKSVHGILSLPFLIDSFDFKPIIIIRNPLSVHSSNIKLENPDIDRNIYLNKQLLNDYNIKINEKLHIGKSIDFLAGLQISIFYKVIEKHIEIYDNLTIIMYEDIIVNTVDKIKNIFDELSIPFSKKVELFILSKMQKGSGYSTNRDTSELHKIWKKRLNTSQINDFLLGYKTIENKFDFDFN